MRKILLISVALAAGAILDARPGQAYDGPWCAVSSMGRGGAIEKCDFFNFEACRMEIIAGNRGFCRQNSRWPGWYSNYAERPAPRKTRKRNRH